jgi:hypothetical protein
MPEGFSSVADLKVIVDANADKFHSSVNSVIGALGDLDKSGNASLGGLDKILAVVGDASLSVTGKFKMLSAGVEAGVALYQQFAKEGRAVAEALGVTTEYDRLIGTLDNLGMSLMDGAAGAFFAVKAAGMDAAAAMFGYASETNKAEAQSEDFAQTLLNSLSDALDRVRLQVNLALPDAQLYGQRLDDTYMLAVQRVRELRQEIADLHRQQAEGGFFSFGIDNLLAQREAELKKREGDVMVLEMRQSVDRVETNALARAWQVDVSTNAEQGLKAEVEALEEKNRRLGLGAVALARYTAEQKALRDLEERGMQMTPEIRASLDAHLATIERLTKAEDDYKKAEQERERAKQLAEQRERAGTQLFANAEREIAALRSRAEAVGLEAGAAAELVMQERLLQQLRASGNEVKEEELTKIRALAAEYGAMTQRLADQQAELRETGEVGQAVAGNLASAFANFTRTGKADWKDMVSSMLQDLAQLQFRRAVLDPLFGGGGAGGGGGSGIFGSILGSIFGGFRAGGGDVEAGRAYVVGENRPELFIPSQSGRILPSADGGRGGADINVYVHGTRELDAQIESTAEGVVVRRAPAIANTAVKAANASVVSTMARHNEDVAGSDYRV